MQDLGAIEVSRSVTDHPSYAPSLGTSLALKLSHISVPINCRFKVNWFASCGTTSYLKRSRNLKPLCFRQRSMNRVPERFEGERLHQQITKSHRLNTFDCELCGVSRH
jgi:hypothetical protein